MEAICKTGDAWRRTYFAEEDSVEFELMVGWLAILLEQVAGC